MHLESSTGYPNPTATTSGFQTRPDPAMTSIRKSKAFTPDGQHTKFLYLILKQLDLKSVNWQDVADNIGIKNGHAARMRWSRFKQHAEGTPPQTKTPKPKKGDGEKGKGKRDRDGGGLMKPADERDEKKVKLEHSYSSGPPPTGFPPLNGYLPISYQMSPVMPPPIKMDSAVKLEPGMNFPADPSPHVAPHSVSTPSTRTAPDILTFQPLNDIPNFGEAMDDIPVEQSISPHQTTVSMSELHLGPRVKQEVDTSAAAQHIHSLQPTFPENHSAEKQDLPMVSPVQSSQKMELGQPEISNKQEVAGEAQESSNFGGCADPSSFNPQMHIPPPLLAQPGYPTTFPGYPQFYRPLQYPPPFYPNFNHPPPYPMGYPHRPTMQPFNPIGMQPGQPQPMTFPFLPSQQQMPVPGAYPAMHSYLPREAAPNPRDFHDTAGQEQLGSGATMSGLDASQYGLATPTDISHVQSPSPESQIQSKESSKSERFLAKSVQSAPSAEPRDSAGEPNRVQNVADQTSMPVSANRTLDGTTLSDSFRAPAQSAGSNGPDSSQTHKQFTTSVSTPAPGFPIPPAQALRNSQSTLPPTTPTTIAPTNQATGLQSQQQSTPGPHANAPSLHNSQQQQQQQQQQPQALAKPPVLNLEQKSSCPTSTRVNSPRTSIQIIAESKCSPQKDEHNSITHSPDNTEVDKAGVDCAAPAPESVFIDFDPGCFGFLDDLPPPPATQNVDVEMNRNPPMTMDGGMNTGMTTGTNNGANKGVETNRGIGMAVDSGVEMAGDRSMEMPLTTGRLPLAPQFLLPADEG